MKMVKFLKKSADKKDGRLNNKGFSLVELIIVIAIMAILVGVVGTQVIPYMESTRRSKDVQILSAYATAGMAAYSYHAESAPVTGTMDVVITATGGADVYTCADAQDIADELKSLVNKDYVANASSSFESRDFVKTAKIVVTYDFDARTISVTAFDSADVLIPNEHTVLGRL